jgi:hypothetical protein
VRTPRRARTAARPRCAARAARLTARARRAGFTSRRAANVARCCCTRMLVVRAAPRHERGACGRARARARVGAAAQLPPRTLLRGSCPGPGRRQSLLLPRAYGRRARRSVARARLARAAPCAAADGRPPRLSGTGGALQLAAASV